VLSSGPTSRVAYRMPDRFAHVAALFGTTEFRHLLQFGYYAGTRKPLCLRVWVGFELLIRSAKFVALDTSILGAVARDYFSSDARIRRKAHKFVDGCTSCGVIPFLTWHHFEELIRHRDY